MSSSDTSYDFTSACSARSCSWVTCSVARGCKSQTRHIKKRKIDVDLISNVGCCVLWFVVVICKVHWFLYTLAVPLCFSCAPEESRKSKPCYRFELHDEPMRQGKCIRTNPQDAPVINMNISVHPWDQMLRMPTIKMFNYYMTSNQIDISMIIKSKIIVVVTMSIQPIKLL